MVRKLLIICTLLIVNSCSETKLIIMGDGYTRVPRDSNYFKNTYRNKKDVRVLRPNFVSSKAVYKLSYYYFQNKKYFVENKNIFLHFFNNRNVIQLVSNKSNPNEIIWDANLSGMRGVSLELKKKVISISLGKYQRWVLMVLLERK